MKRFKVVYAKDALGEVSRDVFKPETPSERNEALARTIFPNAKPKSWTVEDDIAEMRGLVDAGLIGMGWPPSGARLAVADDGSWREIVNPKDVGENEQHRWSFLWIADAAKPLSEAYFLGKMAFCLVAMEDNLARNDMRGFLHNSMRLGMYQTEIDVRIIALRYAEMGHKYLVKSKEGAEKRRGDFAPHTEAVLSEMAKLIAEGHSISEAANFTAMRGIGKNKGANRTLWYRHCKKLCQPPDR